MVAIGQFACYLEQMAAERENNCLSPFLDFQDSKEQ